MASLSAGFRQNLLAFAQRNQLAVVKQKKLDIIQH